MKLFLAELSVQKLSLFQQEDRLNLDSIDNYLSNEMNAEQQDSLRLVIPHPNARVNLVFL